MSDECSPAGYHSLNLEEKVMVHNSMHVIVNIEVSFTAVWSLGDQSTNNDPLLESLRADVSLHKSETSKMSHACNQSGGDPPQK